MKIINIKCLPEILDTGRLEYTPWYNLLIRDLKSRPYNKQVGGGEVILNFGDFRYILTNQLINDGVLFRSNLHDTWSDKWVTIRLNDNLYKLAINGVLIDFGD